MSATRQPATTRNRRAASTRQAASTPAHEPASASTEIPSPPPSTSTGSPCDAWLAAAPYLPPLRDDAARTAERLLLLLHYGIDWTESNWVTARRADYWDTVLPTRVRSATYTSADLHHWYSVVSAALGAAPRDGRQRLELAALLTADPRSVLAVLRERTPALVLRTRIVADAVRTQKNAGGQDG
ncbi:MAG: hypothetical protein WBD41_17780 [Rhodococcus sp. (in: high G+C Gram-positive bacteria)]